MNLEELYLLSLEKQCDPCKKEDLAMIPKLSSIMPMISFCASSRTCRRNSVIGNDAQRIYRSCKASRRVAESKFLAFSFETIRTSC